jgi:hypothetical protein
LKDCASVDHYLGIDKKHGALSQQQLEMADTVKNKLQDVYGKLDAQKSTVDGFKALLERRLGNLEMQLGDSARGNDFLRDMEQRYFSMQEDNKRARDIMESSLQEQIRLEHSAVHSQATQIKEQWDREVKARQAYQENYKDLLGQERSAREAIEVQIESRFDQFERGVYAELQRVWTEIGKEAPQVVVQRVQNEVAPIVVQQPPTIVQREVAPTQYIQMPSRVSTGPPGYVTGSSFVTGTGSITVTPGILPSPTSTMIEYPSTRTLMRDVSGGALLANTSSYTAPAYSIGPSII